MKLRLGEHGKRRTTDAYLCSACKKSAVSSPTKKHAGEDDWQPGTKSAVEPLDSPTPKVGSLSESVVSIQADSTLVKDSTNAQGDSSQLYEESNGHRDVQDSSATRSAGGGQTAEDPSGSGAGTGVSESGQQPSELNHQQPAFSD